MLLPISAKIVVFVFGARHFDYFFRNLFMQKYTYIMEYSIQT